MGKGVNPWRPRHPPVAFRHVHRGFRGLVVFLGRRSVDHGPRDAVEVGVARGVPANSTKGCDVTD